MRHRICTIVRAMNARSARCDRADTALFRFAAWRWIRRGTLDHIFDNLEDD